MYSGASVSCPSRARRSVLGSSLATDSPAVIVRALLRLRYRLGLCRALCLGCILHLQVPPAVHLCTPCLSCRFRRRCLFFFFRWRFHFRRLLCRPFLRAVFPKAFSRHTWLRLFRRSCSLVCKAPFFFRPDRRAGPSFRFPSSRATHCLNNVRFLHTGSALDSSLTW